MKVTIVGNFVGADKKTFTGKKNEPVVWSSITLVSDDNFRYTFTVDPDVFQEYGLDDKKTCEALMGKELTLSCSLYKGFNESGFKIKVVGILAKSK